MFNFTARQVKVAKTVATVVGAVAVVGGLFFVTRAYSRVVATAIQTAIDSEAAEEVAETLETVLAAAK